MNYHLLLWSIGIVLSEIYYVIVAKKFKFKYLTAFGLGMCILLFEIIGAKILFLIENVGSLENAFSWTGGFSLFGAILIMPLALLFLSKVCKISYLKLLDFFSVGAMIELGFYRFGCTVSGCCYGILWSYGISDGNGGYLFPVQPIEATLDLLLSAVLIFVLVKNKYKTGQIFCYTYLGYGMIRFVLEFFRHRTNVFWEISMAHIYAVIIMLFCVGILIYIHRQKKKLETLNSSMI